MDYWIKIDKEADKFNSLLWSRPENKAKAGKLLIIGGNSHAFKAPIEAHMIAAELGVGVCRVVLPDKLEKLIGSSYPDCFFAPSTLSGSFAQTALDGFLDQATWADAVLLAGDLGRNSETAIVIEKMFEKYQGQIIATGDTIDYITTNPNIVKGRPNTCLVPTFAQLQKLAQNTKTSQKFMFADELINTVEALHSFTLEQTWLSLVTRHKGYFIAGHHGEVASKETPDDEFFRVKLAAKIAVWWLQNPSKTFEALAVSTL
jgi:ADP-dependent NAD(P)H-hydrate dehydratase / NAD(P)H-hydrate epimerase